MSAFVDLRGKIAVVTGGASGIGKGIAQRLMVRGMEVVIADVETIALARTAAEIGATGVRVDVRDSDSVAALAQAVVAQHGTVHVVCNNAGVGPLAPLCELTLADWKWVLDVNLWGVIYGVHHFLPILLGNSDGGHIVNTASGSGLATFPGLGTYSVSKYGVAALTEVLAQELAQMDARVGATLLCPGAVRTQMNRSMRNRPAELANSALADVDMEAGNRFVDNVRVAMKSTMRMIDPTEVGDIVIEAMARGDLYAITHPETYPHVRGRLDAIEAAFAHAKARLEASSQTADG
jgi:NAD(P)-dependent dehydrogenase (short-subunit alcohol dehydrogenase family)